MYMLSPVLSFFFVLSCLVHSANSEAGEVSARQTQNQREGKFKRANATSVILTPPTRAAALTTAPTATETEDTCSSLSHVVNCVVKPPGVGQYTWRSYRYVILDQGSKKKDILTLLSVLRKPSLPLL